MAQTYSNNDNVLSKVKLGSIIYYLKDAAAREILDTFGNVVTYNVATAIADNVNDLVTADQVYDYVGRQVGAIGTALNLRSESDHTLIPAAGEENGAVAGDFIVETDGSEWLYDGISWREVGSENAYVVKTFTIAGIDMQDNITKAELQSALELKALAYKDSGSVKITTIDSINSFSTGKAGNYNVSSTPVTVPVTYDALDVTPAGSVSITAGTATAVSYDKTSSVTISSATPGEEQIANYTPTGDVTITNVTVTPSTGSVATVTNAGTSYSLTDGSVTQGSDTTSLFATQGIVASVGTNNGEVDESETLILTAANVSDAVTASGTISYTKQELSGSLPTFGSQSVVTGITSASATASFSGTGTILSAIPGYTSNSATVTQPTFTGSFEGTSKTVTPTVATTTNAAGTDGSVNIASENITPTFTNSEKTATVTFTTNT